MRQSMPALKDLFKTHGWRGHKARTLGNHYYYSFLNRFKTLPFKYLYFFLQISAVLNLDPRNFFLLTARQVLRMADF